MNTPLKIYTNTVRTLEGGSAMYGECEICDCNCPVIYCAQKHQVWQRPDGSMYLNPVGGGAYGHTDCLISVFGTLRSHADFPLGLGNTPRPVTQAQFDQLKGIV